MVWLSRYSIFDIRYTRFGEAVKSCWVTSIFEIFYIRYSIIDIGRSSKIMWNCFDNEIFEIRRGIKIMSSFYDILYIWYLILNIWDQEWQKNHVELLRYSRYSIFNIRYTRLGDAVKSCRVASIFEIFNIHYSWLGDAVKLCQFASKFDIWYWIFNIWDRER